MSYATLDEFVWRLQLQSPSPDALDAAQRALDAATREIDGYMSWLDTPPTLSGDELALVKWVNLDRASEHWRNTPFGALPTGPDLPPVLTARDSFYRHARKLASLKTSWGVG